MWRQYVSFVFALLSWMFTWLCFISCLPASLFAWPPSVSLSFVSCSNSLLLISSIVFLHSLTMNNHDCFYFSIIIMYDSTVLFIIMYVDGTAVVGLISNSDTRTHESTGSRDLVCWRSGVMKTALNWTSAKRKNCWRIDAGNFVLLHTGDWGRKSKVLEITGSHHLTGSVFTLSH